MLFGNADEYAEAYKLNRTDLDADDVRATKDAASKLNTEEWLLVNHSNAA